MKFTIITVCYNEKNKIRKTIENVLHQEYQNLEYLIIDGKSTDGTLDIIYDYAQKDSRVKVLSEKDYGIYNAMNKGINIASGDYINFMNVGDTFYDLQVLSRVSRMLMKSKPDIFYGKANVIERDGRTCNIRGEECGGLRGLLKAIDGEWAYHQAVFATTENLRKYYFNESYKIAADYDWFMRNLRDKTKIVFGDLMICNYMRDGFSCKTSNRARLQKEKKLIVKRNFKRLYYINQVLKKWMI